LKVVLFKEGKILENAETQKKNQKMNKKLFITEFNITNGIIIKR